MDDHDENFISIHIKISLLAGQARDDTADVVRNIQNAQ
jgi:hypothetical protein